MRLVNYLSAQIAFISIALLTVAPAASASTHAHTAKSASVKSTSTKSGSSSKKTSKTAKSSSKSSHSRHSKYKRTAKKSWKAKGQKGISSDRAREIQEALIREHYLDGEPTGVWDSQTQEACRKFQADNGWQAKVLPDSRALIKLGLGPDHKNVLNPETAATSPYLPGGGLKSDTMPATAVVPEQ